MNQQLVAWVVAHAVTYALIKDHVSTGWAHVIGGVAGFYAASQM